MSASERDLKIEKWVKNLSFIDNFHKYEVKNKKINIGDAVVHFIEGDIYQACPSRNVLFFVGRWIFEIFPSEEEERLNLKILTKSESFRNFYNDGIFF